MQAVLLNWHFRARGVFVRDAVRRLRRILPTTSLAQLLAITLFVNGAIESLQAQSIPTPTLASVTPNSAPAGSTTPITLTLTGSGFFAGSAVSINNALVDTTFVNTTTLTAIFNPASYAPTLLPVYVINSDSTGQRQDSGTLNFYVFPAVAPTVTSITAKSNQLNYADPSQLAPTVGATGGYTEARMTGNNLLGATVTVSGTGVTVTYGVFNTGTGGPPWSYSSSPLPPQQLNGNNLSLQIEFRVAPDATPGTRTFTVATPGGATSQCGGQPCTFNVIDGGSVKAWSPLYAFRTDSSATQLLDGRVLIVGGQNMTTLDWTQAQLLDPTSNISTGTGNLNVGRHGHAAVLLPDGRVLVAGGMKFNGTPTSSVEIYDTGTGTWSAVQSMPNSAGAVRGLLLTNGHVGLWGTNTYDEYDPVSGSFNEPAVPDLVPDPRRIALNLSGTLLLDGRVFVRQYSSPFCSTLQCPLPQYSALIYTPALVNGVLTNGSSVPAASPLDGPGLLLSTGRVHISSSAGKFLYDPNTNSTMPTGDSYQLFILLRDGRGFSLGQIYTPPGLIHPAPQISAITPQLPSSNASPITLLITGSDFLPNSTVQLGTQTLVSLFLGGNTLVAFVPPALRSSFNLSSVTVANPVPGGGTASLSGSVPAAPVITAITPAVAIQGTTSQAILTGVNLTGATSATVSGAGVTATIQSSGTDSQLPLSVTVDANAPLGARSITVSTAAGSYTLDSALSIQAPAITVPTTTPQPIVEVEQGVIHSGYLILTPDINTTAPTPQVTFGMVNGGLVQSQAGMFPGPMTTDASLFVEVIPGIGRNLGVALANPGSTTNTITLTMRDTSGTLVGTPITVSLQPQQQIAKFLNELFSSSVVGAGFRGSMEAQSSTPFAVLGLRFSGTDFSTFPLLVNATTAGVPSRTLTSGSTANMPLAGTVGGNAAVILPQFAMGGGWATQIAIVNNSANTMSGRIDIFDTSGNPLAVGMNGATQSTFIYSVPAGGALVLSPRDTNGQSPF